MSNWKKTLSILESKVNLKNKEVLDIGCGDGWLLSWCNKLINSGIGIDPSSEQIKLAIKRNKYKNVSYKNVGAEGIDILNKKFDVIFFFNSFHHVPEAYMSNALEMSASSMHSNSLLIIIEPIADGSFYKFMKPIDDEYKVRLKAYETIQHLIKYKFNINFEDFYEESKTFDSFNNCIDFLKNVDNNRIPYIENNITILKNSFEELAIYKKNKYVFNQPMRINILSLQKG